MLTYKQLTTPNSAEMQLLLLADPSEKKLAGYLPTSVVFSASDASGLAGILVMKSQSAQTLEIMNIAVVPDKQRRGYAQELLAFAQRWAQQQAYQILRIATGSTSLTQLYVYQKCGFRMCRVMQDYFTRHYEYPIYENGLRLRDQIVLEKPVRNA